MSRGALYRSVLVLAFVPGAWAAPSVAELRGDAAWVERARGFAQTGRVDPDPAGRAVTAFEQALAADPGNSALRFKAIEALYFAAHFATADARLRRDLYERQLDLADDAFSRVEAGADVPYAREACFWSAISWGTWAMSHGSLAAARRGAAGKIRERAEKLIALDERYASAGGLRLLGRLHTNTPKVPFVTGWIDRQHGLALLRRANAISTDDPRNPLFLAEAILDHEPNNRSQALALLHGVTARTPDPEQLVEQTEILDQARAALVRAEKAD